jgi:hypothetical protein
MFVRCLRAIVLTKSKNEKCFPETMSHLNLKVRMKCLAAVGRATASICSEASRAGKTTLALQFLLEGASKCEKGLYITLSETRDKLLGVAESHGWNLDPFCVLTRFSSSPVQEP